MRILLLTEATYPFLGNNVNQIGKLLYNIQNAGHEVRLFASAFGKIKNKLPTTFYGVPLCWATNEKSDLICRVLDSTASKLLDPHGFSDELAVRICLRELKEIRKGYPFDAVISTSEPYPMAVAASQLRSVKKILYLMDPPACVSNGAETKYRNQTLKSVLRRHDYVLTTPFIQKALEEHGFPKPKKGYVTVGFPMIQPHDFAASEQKTDKIRLLFCGWLYSDIRSPQYFLDIVSRLDERFEVTFMGRECELLQERFPIETKAKLITLPQKPYETALQAMADADIMINIGNSVPVHMPSKTLEYINTGKPMVNFYKMEDCPTLYYTKRYPLALNLYEGNADVDQAAKTFVRFCEENKGKTVDRDYILHEYADCTPEYIAQKILDCLEN